MTEYYIPGAVPEFVRTGQAFTLAGVQYPRKWLALAGAGDLASVGAVAKPSPGPDETVEQGESGWVVRAMTAPELDARDDAEAADFAAAVVAAHAAIDAGAGAARASLLTMVAGQEMTYLRKEDQAKAYLADGDPDDADYPLLQASIGADAFPAGHPNAGQLVETVADAAAVVMLVSAAWLDLGSKIEKIRLRGKRLVTVAPDASGVAAAVAWSQAAYAAALAGDPLPAEPE
ncbi:hypothetical protein [Oceanibaculum indicum]|uniref:Uncharacterized protein n=1 Tax=Oceanibaculum indicum P24 TaxID=1207063 RepID=K2IL91_9PROT|nr:hypothetical protein [Oceanibaculum indicum]EKE70901.1 hypothetical protein P24_15199 [Oceanibaculum indicum P24]